MKIKFDFMKFSGLSDSLNLILMGNFNKTKYLHFDSHFSFYDVLFSSE